MQKGQGFSYWPSFAMQNRLVIKPRDSQYQCLLQEELVKENIPNLQTWLNLSTSLYLGRKNYILGLPENVFSDPFSKNSLLNGVMTRLEIVGFMSRMYFLYVLLNPRLLSKVALIRDYQFGCFCKPDKPRQNVVDMYWRAQCHCDVLRYIIEIFENPSSKPYYNVTSFKIPQSADPTQFPNTECLLQEYIEHTDLLASIGEMFEQVDRAQMTNLKDEEWQKNPPSCRNQYGHPTHVPCLCYDCRKAIYDEGVKERERRYERCQATNRLEFFLSCSADIADRARVLHVATNILDHVATYFGIRRNPIYTIHYQKLYRRIVMQNERTNAKHGKTSSMWINVASEYDPMADEGDASILLDLAHVL